MRNIQVLIVLLISMLIFPSCVSTEKTAAGKGEKRMPVTPAGLSELDEMDWSLESMTKENRPIALVADSKITFSIKNDGKIGGLATLNRYFGNLALSEEGNITWKGPGLGMTKMAGAPELMKQEDAFVDALWKCQRIYRQGPRLVLESNDQAVILVFTRLNP